MEKNKKIKIIDNPELYNKGSKINEMKGSSLPVKTLSLKEFNYKEFKKISERASFTQQEWSNILHISERTLQRYSKNNGAFKFSVADRIIQVDKVIRRGAEVFGSLDKFLLWIRNNPPAMEGKLSLLSLGNFEGIALVLKQLGRIEQGIFS